MTLYQAINSDLENWLRLGRGRNVTFIATDEEVQEWLSSCLPAGFGPYRLVGADLVREGKHYVQLPFSGQIDELSQLMHRPDRDAFQFCIWSKTLTPDLELTPRTNIAAQLGVNGLISLQHGSKIKDYSTPDQLPALWPSSLGVIDRVQNRETGEIRHYAEYLQIYSILKRAMKKLTIYSAVLRFKTGEEEEVVGAGAPLWTEGAKRLHDAGVRFCAVRPGRLPTQRR